MISIINKDSIYYYNNITILDIIMMGEYYNIITNDGDIFLHKDNCYTDGDSIIYRDKDIEIIIDKIK